MIVCKNYQEAKLKAINIISDYNNIIDNISIIYRKDHEEWVVDYKCGVNEEILMECNFKLW